MDISTPAAIGAVIFACLATIALIMVIFWYICNDVPAGSVLTVTTDDATLAALVKMNPWLGASSSPAIPAYQFVSMNPNGTKLPGSWKWTVSDSSGNQLLTGTAEATDKVYFWAWPTFMF